MSGALDLSGVSALELFIVCRKAAALGAAQAVFRFVGAVNDFGFNVALSLGEYSLAFTEGAVGQDRSQFDFDVWIGAWRLGNHRYDLAAGAGSEAFGFYDSALTAFPDRPLTSDNSGEFGPGTLYVGENSGGSAILDGGIARMAFTLPLTAAQRAVVISSFVGHYGVP